MDRGLDREEPDALRPAKTQERPFTEAVTPEPLSREREAITLRGRVVEIGDGLVQARPGQVDARLVAQALPREDRSRRSAKERQHLVPGLK